MGKHMTTCGSDPEGLAELLGMGVGADENTEESVAELLRATFAAPLPFEAATEHDPPLSMGELFRDLMPMGGPSLCEVLLDGNTELAVIEKIKKHGKKLARRAEPLKSVGVAIYYAAIASALLFYGKRITSYSYAYLGDSFADVDSDWMSPGLASHISRALQVCRERAKD